MRRRASRRSGSKASPLAWTTACRCRVPQGNDESTSDHADSRRIELQSLERGRAAVLPRSQHRCRRLYGRGCRNRRYGSTDVEYPSDRSTVERGIAEVPEPAGGLASRGRLRLASRSSTAISATNRALRARPNTKSTRFAWRQAISASRANPESARKRMRVFGQRVRIWPTIRAASSTDPALVSMFEGLSLAARRCRPRIRNWRPSLGSSPGCIWRPAPRQAKARAAALCLAMSAARSTPSGLPSMTRHDPATITRSARCAPQSGSAAIGSWAPEKRGSSSV